MEGQEWTENTNNNNQMMNNLQSQSDEKEERWTILCESENVIPILSLNIQMFITS